MIRAPHKAILLAGGRGTRLYPLTATASKHFLPIYNKPMIYYSLTVAILVGMREILLVTTPEDLPRFEMLFGDGRHLGITIQYAIQPEPRGIADAVRIGADFIADDSFLLLLGDNLIYGRLDFFRDAVQSHRPDEAIIFANQVRDPSRYGVVEFDRTFRAISIEEKPTQPRSRWAIPGIYLFGPEAVARAEQLTPSARGELEITDLLDTYLRANRLKVRPMGRGIAWFDTGTPESLQAASNFVAAVETRQGLIIGSPEEAAFRMGFLDRHGFLASIERLPISPYRDYLQRIHEEADLPWS